MRRFATICFLMVLAFWQHPSVSFAKEDTNKNEPESKISIEKKDKNSQKNKPTKPDKKPNIPGQTDENSSNWKVHVAGAKQTSPSTSEEDDEEANHTDNPFMNVQISGKVKGKPIEIEKELPSLDNFKLDADGDIDISNFKLKNTWKISYNGKTVTIDKNQEPKLKWKYDENHRPVAVQVQFKGKVGNQVILVNKNIKVDAAKKKPQKTTKDLQISYQKVKDKLRVRASLIDVTSGKGTWTIKLNKIAIERRANAEIEVLFSKKHFKDKGNRLTISFKGIADERTVIAKKTIQFDLDGQPKKESKVSSPVKPKSQKIMPKKPTDKSKQPPKVKTKPQKQESKSKTVTVHKQTSSQPLGGLLPKTSTDYPHSVLIGLIVLMGGLLNLYLKKKSS